MKKIRGKTIKIEYPELRGVICFMGFLPFQNQIARKLRNVSVTTQIKTDTI